MNVRAPFVPAAHPRWTAAHGSFDHHALRSVRATIAEMSRDAAAEYVADLLDWYLPSQDREAALRDMGLRCRPLTMRMIICLALHNGREVSTDAIMAHLYADRSVDDQPGPEIVKVKVCQARRAIEENFLPVKIETVGSGYRLRRLGGFQFPWETGE